MYNTILVAKAEGVATITLNRPEKLNALNRQMMIELGEALTDVAKDGAARAVVVTGAGRGFCAGADLSSSVLDEVGDDLNMQRDAELIILTMKRMAKPVIVAVNGCAVGGGLSIALAGDMIIASDRATFGSPLIKLGLIPDMGCSSMLPRRVGVANAFDLMCTGKIIEAAEALRIGLVNQVAPHEQLSSVVTDLAGGLAKGPAAALSAIKETLSKEAAIDIEKAMRNEARVVKGLMALDDFRAGLQASRDKRSAASKG